MDNKKKIVITLAVVGLVLVCVGAVLGGSLSSIPSIFSEANLPEGVQSTEEVKNSDVHAIELNLINSDITVKLGKQFDLSGTGNFCSYIKDGVFYAGADSKRSASVFGMKINVPAQWVCGYGSYVLTIPTKAKLDNISINTFHCDIAADTLQASNLNITMKAGNLTVNHATADTLNVDVNSGKVSILNALISNSGSIEASKGVVIGGENAMENSLNSVSLSSSWGDIALMGQITGTSQIQTGFGDVTATLPGSSANYGLTSQKGDLNINPAAGAESSTEHFADISFSCKHGNATVNFQ